MLSIAPIDRFNSGRLIIGNQLGEGDFTTLGAARAGCRADGCRPGNRVYCCCKDQRQIEDTFSICTGIAFWCRRGWCRRPGSRCDGWRLPAKWIFLQLIWRPVPGRHLAVAVHQSTISGLAFSSSKMSVLTTACSSTFSSRADLGAAVFLVNVDGWEGHLVGLEELGGRCFGACSALLMVFGRTWRHWNKVA